MSKVVKVAKSVVSGVAAGFGLSKGRKADRVERDARRRSEAQATTLARRASDLYGTYDQKGRPLVENYLDEAGRGVNPEQEADIAAVDVNKQFARLKRGRQRELNRYGLDPSDPAFVSLNDSLDLAKAATEAGLRTNVRRRTRDINFARLQDGATFGRNLAVSSFSPTATAGDMHGRLAARKGAEASDYYAGALANAKETLGGVGEFI